MNLKHFVNIKKSNDRIWEGKVNKFSNFKKFQKSNLNYLRSVLN